MTKQAYLAPQAAVVALEMVTMVCTSGVVGGGSPDEPGSDIGYGGVDDGGSKDPSSRRHDVWDDPQDEEE